MRTRFLAAMGLCLSLVGFAFADLGPRPIRRPQPVQPQVPLPPPPKVPAYPLVIEASPNVAEAKLVIPRKALGMLKGELQQEETPAIAAKPRLHTIIAGSALALGLAFSGVWLVRRGQVSGRTMGLAAGAVVLLGVGAAVWADGIGPRPRPRPIINPPNANNLLIQVNPLLQSPRMDNVTVEIVDKGDSIKLIISNDKVTKAIYESFAKQQAMPKK